MVKIIYGEHSQQADLAGKSVAEARELYRSEFGIPDRAQASLNDQQLKKKLEPETKLSDEDKLSFEEKSRRPLVLLGAFLLVLAVTSSLFAYTFTTTTKQIGVTAFTEDYASITENTTAAPDPYVIVGKLRGKIDDGTLFDVTAADNYTGDLEVNVYLSNVDKLTENYSFWMMRLAYTDSGTGGTKADMDGITQVLSLNNPMVSFTVDADNTTGYVECEGGSFRAFRGSWLSDDTAYDPLIFGQVVQAGGPHP